MRINALLVVAFAVFVPVHALADIGDPPPPIEKGLLDCSLYRYGDQFDVALDRTLRRIADATFTDPALEAAFEGARRQDVTDQLYALGLLYRVTDCPQPVVRGYAGEGKLVLEVAALQAPVCQQLVVSETLRLSGLLVEPLHIPSGELRCGLARNPFPGLLTGGRMTQAGRSLPGENTVKLIARGPFAPSAALSCPGVAGRTDSVIEDMLAKRWVITTDYPRNWQVEPCRDILGGTSSMGMVCGVADWNNYQQRLYDEFERMMILAEASGEPERIMSAASWMIDHNDPMRLTILSFDYPGQDCDAIRNRIVTAWGLCLADGVKDAVKEGAFDWLTGQSDIGEVKADIKLSSQESVVPCFFDVPGHYKDANDFINDWLRPMPAPEKRLQVMTKARQRVRSAMAKIGKGDCEYYAEAVTRFDQMIWRDHYQYGIAQMPIDWNHDFWKSARTCAATAW